MTIGNHGIVHTFAHKLNKAEKLPVYGIVMDGELWQFGKLVSDEFTKSKLRITITDLDKIFRTISFLLSSKREADFSRK